MGDTTSDVDLASLSLQETYEPTVLDLHDISLLLTYERGAYEPRFRYAKLREVAFDPPSEFETIRVLTPEWTDVRPGQERLGLVFDRVPPKSKGRTKAKNANQKGKAKAAQDDSNSDAEDSDPDLPTNMLPTPLSPRLRKLGLTSTQLETYYWQARNHDGCFRTVSLFQHFLDLFPPFTRLRIRTVTSTKDNTTGKAKEKPRTYTTLASPLIIEFHLLAQSTLTLSTVLPEGMSYISGAEPSTIHAVLGFSAPSPSAPSSPHEADTILDLAALQFGTAGRGSKGRGLFVLEPIENYIHRLDRFATGGNTFRDAKRSVRISDSAPDREWLKHVARKVKRRWEERDKIPWCGHCGAPPREGQDLKRCTKCRKVFYCDAEHQLAAWPFHKHFCVAEDGGDTTKGQDVDKKAETA
ncbi:hypothetical protein CVT26_003285 [Gymnopilus dilepis]|uniref:MYND-type domain-containing protein n=1 Tax=Gymnopilus dilepis TaxID=231916 RepID=A0A409Y4Z0_9AGAR|nr:hypothetical protein CVT26_003285 [Gymnopilus dilepis]